MSSDRNAILLCVAAVALAAAPMAQAAPVAHAPLCDAAPAGTARCHAKVVTDAAGVPQTTSVPSGYGPADLRAAYGLTSLSPTGGSGQTVAIVDAYDDPGAEADLAVYRAQYGLPACTTANGCFRKVDQRGGTAYPATDAGWSQEISLDLAMVSAICPNCRILLVEADSAAMGDLAAAVQQAAALGATQISNSYGSPEYAGETADEAAYDQPGIAVTVSAGDSGYGVQFPAASRYVTAVGGTSLQRDANAAGGWTETAWSGSGSGCSSYVPKPSWQSDAGCAGRTVADVAAVADPQTGVAVYDSLGGGWMVFGGTSVAAPIVAAFAALLGSDAAAPSYPYSRPGSYFDIVSGANGSCAVSYLCVAGPGYDGPTGLGSPDGLPADADPGAVTGSASGLTQDAAQLSGTVTAPAGALVSFQYGTSSAYGSTTPVQQVAAGASPQSVSVAVTGLSPSTTYHYRLVAICDCRGGASYGSDATLRSAGPPAAVTGSATSISATTATLQGSIDANGLATTYHFEYGTSTAYGQRAPGSDGTASAPSQASAVAAPAAGLAPATTYHFRLVASNAAGVSYGADQTFATAPPPPATSRLLGYRVAPTSAAALRKRGLHAWVSCTTPCRLTARIVVGPYARRGTRSPAARPVTIATVRRNVGPRGRAIVIRLDRGARRLLARRRAARLQLRLNARSAGGPAQVTVVPIGLRH